MEFENLEDKCLYYRSLSDARLLPNSYVIVMLDGKNFSSKIKKKFNLPFDKKFVDYMNKTAIYLVKNIQGAKLAYTQSDEISIVLCDFKDDGKHCGTFFQYRIEKICSIIASMASSYFNRIVLEDILSLSSTLENAKLSISLQPLYEFDCKCWNVPTFNDVFAWFLYRQIDCIRNSKQQVAQTYLSHKQLLNKSADEQIELLKKEKGIDWNTDFVDEVKFGRFIYGTQVRYEYTNNSATSSLGNATIPAYVRNVVRAYPGFELTEEEGRERFFESNIIPHLQ